LILGETGTGKEEAARLVHRLSARSNYPFVAVNCSALPANLAESELFGHEKGAFTGAQGLRKGRFELANGGTLFLDEAGDLPLEVQPKLLRALQEGLFERVGGEQTVRVDVRLIAATNMDLTTAVEKGQFREDLFYRLSVFPIKLPPLRERGLDVILLAQLFASRLRLRTGWENLSFNEEALDALTCLSWPGNVRELKNAIERAAILAVGGIMGPEHFSSGEQNCILIPCSNSNVLTDINNILSLDEIQKQHILKTLKACSGKIYGKNGAASKLGLKPTTLQSRMKKLGITKVQISGSQRLISS
jgi:hydrogenase-4 transcriptional activator